MGGKQRQLQRDDGYRRLGKKSVWESIAAPSWSYNQANFSFMDQVYMMPGYRTMQNTNLTIYSIEKVSN